MNHLHRPFIFLSLLLLPSLSRSEVLDYTVLPNSPSYEAAAEPLRDAPSGEFKFNNARLGDVLQLLANEAGISFFSLPAESEIGSRIVTFTLNSSPFLALETLTKANGIALLYDNGIWYLRPENDTSLIGRVYQITYNSRETVTAQASGGNIQTSSSLSSTGGTASIGVDLQGTTQMFETEPSRLLDDIRELLDIPISAHGLLAGTTSVDALAGGYGGASTIILPSNLAATPNTPEQATAREIANGAKVIWNSDASTLYVVATRQQHQWIEGYLAASDKPQDQIAIEVKFFETTQDPRREFGIDWSDTLGDGYDVSLHQGPDGDIDTIVDLDRLGDIRPPTAILSVEDVRFQIDALYNDLNTRSVSYPRMVTTNNREVLIRSVINQPVLAGSSSASLGAGATTSQAISYLPIGTVLNILPKRLGNGKIQLNIALTVSSIIGTQYIGGNPYPVASSRVYNAPVEVDPGYTVAIGGLDEATYTQDEIGIPALRKIPVLGYAFKSKSERRERKSLLIFITPDVIDPRLGGLPDEPQYVRRGTPFDPPPPTILEDGSMLANPDDVLRSLNALERELNLLETEMDDYRSEPIHRERIRALEMSIRKTRLKVTEFIKMFPERRDELLNYDNQLVGMNRRLQKIQRRATWMLY